MNQDINIKDVSPDDIYYMTWLIECVELDDNGEPYAPIFHETISQDYYIPEADYILNQKTNDDQLNSQIDRFWALEASKEHPYYGGISGYLKELAIKYVHKKCVRYGSQNIHEYFEDWIDHTKALLSVEGDRLSYIVFLYDIDELVKLVRSNLKLYTMLLYRPANEDTAKMLKIRLKHFFAIEQSKIISKKKPTPKAPLNLKYDISKIINKLDFLYEFAIDTNVISTEITKTQFNFAIERADFSEIYVQKQTKRSKTNLILKQINVIYGNRNWYTDITGSIGLTPSKCSGANPNDDDWIAKLKNL